MKNMKDRKMIGIRIPLDLLREYERQAEKEGHGTLTGWIIAVLNDRLANNWLTRSQHKREAA